MNKDEMYQKALELLPEKVELVYVDYNSNLKDHGDIIARCIKAGTTVPLDESYFDWFSEAHYQGVESVKDELRTSLLHYYDWMDVANFMRICNDTLTEVIEDRDCGDPIKECLENTDMLCRIELYSNYEAFTPLCYLDAFSYDGYAYDLINTLKLNPAKVKHELEKNGIKCAGRFPNYEARNGKEVVSYPDFVSLLQETCCYSRLTFIGKAPFDQMYAKGFHLGKVTIPKGTKVLMYNSWEGSGSVEVETAQDCVLNLSKTGKTKYDYLKLILDERESNGGCGYDTNDVYGWGYRFDELFNVA